MGTNRMHTEGKEMFRIQGCYMYMINSTGCVGAFLGFKTLTVVVPECREDVDPEHAFLRCFRWFYPLSKSFAPIYIWGPDKIIFPEPFSCLKHPSYIIVRMPYGMSDYQKSTLWNLLDMFAHVRGQFTSISEKQRTQLERRFYLTEMFPYDEKQLDDTLPNQNSPDLKIIKPLKFPRIGYKGKPLVEGPVHLEVTLNQCVKCALHRNKKAQVTIEKCCYQREMCEPCYGSIVPRSHINEMPYTSQKRFCKEKITAGGIPHDWVSLYDYNGNILRQYLIGPRDRQFISITDVPMSIGISQIVHSAVRTAYKEQVRLRHEKELAGIPPTFDMRKQRLLAGWGKAAKLNAFGADIPNRLPNLTKCCCGVPKQIGLGAPFEEVMELQHLESAAEYFDKCLLKCRLFLLSCEPDESESDEICRKKITLSLTPVPIHVRYHCDSPLFASLMTLPACIKNEIIYKKTTNYFERIKEDCEHHYPTQRPRNPYLDPAYTYSRYAPTYKVPTGSG